MPFYSDGSWSGGDVPPVIGLPMGTYTQGLPRGADDLTGPVPGVADAGQAVACTEGWAAAPT